MDQRTQGSMFVLASAATFSSEAIFVKLAYGSGLTGFSITVYRMLLAALISAPIFLRFAWKTKLHYREHLTLLGLGGLLHSGVVILLTLAIGLVDASVAILCLYMYPALTTLISVPLLGESITRQRVLSLLGAIFGVCMVVWAPGVTIDSRGVALALSACVINAVLLVLVKKRALHLPPFVCSSGMLVYSGAALSVASLLGAGVLFGESSVSNLLRIGSISTESLMIIASLSVFSTVLPLMLLYRGMAMIDASLASIICTTEPVITAVIAFFVLGERLGVRQLFGGLLVFFSALILGLR